MVNSTKPDVTLKKSASRSSRSDFGVLRRRSRIRVAILDPNQHPSDWLSGASLYGLNPGHFVHSRVRGRQVRKLKAVCAPYRIPQCSFGMTAAATFRAMQREAEAGARATGPDITDLAWELDSLELVAEDRWQQHTRPAPPTSIDSEVAEPRISSATLRDEVRTVIHLIIERRADRLHPLCAPASRTRRLTLRSDFEMQGFHTVSGPCGPGLQEASCANPIC